MTRALELEGFGVRLAGRSVVTGVDWSVTAGEVVGVVGPNGAGKSSLLRGALGLLRHDGSARLFGREVAALSEAERASRVTYLPQERRIAWGVPARTVAELGAVLKPRAARERAAARALERVGLAALADRGVFEMSGGERARALLARVLAAEAPLIVADEPTSDLDPGAQFDLLAILREEAARGAAVVVTLHDLTLAARFCDRLLVLDGGRVVADGAPQVALGLETLTRVFGMEGEFVETSAGPMLVTRRRSPAPA